MRGKFGAMVRAGCMLLALLALVFAAFRFEKTVYSYGTALMHYGLPGMLLAISIFPNRMVGRNRNALFINFFSIFVALYCFEAYTQFLAGKMVVIRDALPQNALVINDPMAKVSLIKDYRNRGIEAYPEVHVMPIVSIGDFDKSPIVVDKKRIQPLSRISKTFTIGCNENGYYNTYKTDRYGFRNPDTLWDRTPSKIIAFLGDSFVAGSCVSEGKNLPDVMREKIPGILNLGKGGAGPLKQLGIFKEYVEPIKPSVVLWGHWGRSGNRAVREERIEGLRAYLEPTHRQNLRELQPKLDAALRRYANDEMTKLENNPLAQEAAPVLLREAAWQNNLFLGLRNFAVLRNFRNYIYWYAPFLSNSLRRVEYVPKVLSIVRDSVISWGGTFIVVYIPRREELVDRQPGPYQRKFLEQANRLSIPIINTFDELVGRDVAALYSHKRAHFNEHGYSLIGAILATKLAHQLSTLEKIRATTSE